MKYLGTCIITEEVIKFKITKHNRGYFGIGSDNVYVYIPIKHDTNRGDVLAKFEVSGVTEQQIRELIDNLCGMSEDAIKHNIPLTERQVSSLKRIIVDNPPKSAICIEPQPSNSLTLGAYRSGKNYSIKLGDNILCDLNGENNADNVISIISSAFYTVFENLKQQINTP